MRFIPIKRQERRSLKHDIEVNTVTPTSKCVETIITMTTKNGELRERLARQSCLLQVITSHVTWHNYSILAMGLIIRDSNPGVGRDFPHLQNVQIDCEVHPVSYSMPPGAAFPRVKRFGMRLIPQSHLVPRLRITAAIPQLSAYDFMAWARTAVLLLFHYLITSVSDFIKVSSLRMVSNDL